MATITYSPLIADIRGSAGGATFAAWKGRGYVRSKVKPGNPNSSAQQTVRNSMARLSPLWRSLPTEVKATQDLYAGRDSKSGWNWFVSQNRVLEESYGTNRLTPPSNALDPVTGLDDTDNGGGSVDITWDAASSHGAGDYVDVWSRVIDGDDSDTEFTRHDDGETVLATAETVTLTLAASTTYEIVVAVHDPAADIGPGRYSISAAITVTLGA